MEYETFERQMMERLDSLPHATPEVELKHVYEKLGLVNVDELTLRDINMCTTLFNAGMHYVSRDIQGIGAE